jgi:hypothetical protein
MIAFLENTGGGAGAGAHKIENEQSDFKVVTVGFDFKMALQKARQAKNLTQARLFPLLCSFAPDFNAFTLYTYPRLSVALFF